jgi:hypothetical protein
VSAYFGKTFQLIGLVTVAAALVLGIHERDMWTELLFFGVGLALFGGGTWLLRRYA